MELDSIRPFTTVHGIDFSGARQAGHALWWATLARKRSRWHLTRLTSLADLLGTAERGEVLAHLREVIRASEAALWALDFSFSLPAVLLDGSLSWRCWLAEMAAGTDDPRALGRACAERARERTGRSQTFRQTERDNGTRLTAYHARLVRQTFYGVRELLVPLGDDPGTVVLPFEYARLPHASRVLVEALPAATLRRAGWPDRQYKSSGRGTEGQRAVRKILAGHLARRIVIPPERRGAMIANGGGDALDAVLAAWGAVTAWDRVDHAAVAANPLYGREGYEYA